MSDSNNSKSNSIGFGTLLTVLFIGLKLTHYIDWSWLWVLSPMWIPLATSIVVLIAGLLMAVVGAVIAHILE